MRAVVVTLVVLLSLAISSVADAVPPVREYFTVHLTGFAPAVSTICGFRIERDNYINLIDTAFFDKDGNPRRFLEVAPGTKLTWINPANGKSVTYANVFSIHQTLNADGSIDEFDVGLVYRAIVPGEGASTVNSGRLVLHISPTGVVTVVSDVGPSDSFQGVCDALR
jgi:hypothetical protein